MATLVSYPFVHIQISLSSFVLHRAAIFGGSAGAARKSCLLGSGKRTIGDFSSQQLLLDPYIFALSL